eukprot:364900-Chlamydomonas_euryale.AAC.4
MPLCLNALPPTPTPTPLPAASSAGSFCNAHSVTAVRLAVPPPVPMAEPPPAGRTSAAVPPNPSVSSVHGGRPCGHSRAAASDIGRSNITPYKQRLCLNAWRGV